MTLLNERAWAVRQGRLPRGRRRPARTSDRLDQRLVGTQQVRLSTDHGAGLDPTVGLALVPAASAMVSGVGSWSDAAMPGRVAGVVNCDPSTNQQLRDRSPADPGHRADGTWRGRRLLCVPRGVPSFTDGARVGTSSGARRWTAWLERHPAGRHPSPAGSTTPRRPSGRASNVPTSSWNGSRESTINYSLSLRVGR